MQSKKKTLFNELNKHVKQINHNARAQNKSARTRTEITNFFSLTTDLVKNAPLKENK